ncbi:MAG TPA: hypothetical protein VGP64_05205 [Polyangia bacterium]|jgi:hypothetical protein
MKDAFAVRTVAIVTLLAGCSGGSGGGRGGAGGNAGAIGTAGAPGTGGAAGEAAAGAGGGAAAGNAGQSGGGGAGGAAGAAGSSAGAGTLLDTLESDVMGLAVDTSRVYLLIGSGLTSQTPGTEVRTVPVAGGSDSSLVTETGKPISIAVGGGSLVFGVEAGPYGAGNPHVYAGTVSGGGTATFADILPAGSADRLGAGLVIKNGTVLTGAGITVSGPERTGILSFALAGGGSGTPLALTPANTLGLTNYPSRLIVTDSKIFWIGNAPGVFQGDLTAAGAAVEISAPGFYAPTSIALVGDTLYAEAFAPIAPKGAILAIATSTRAVSTALSATAYTAYQADLLFDGTRLYWDAVDTGGNGTLLSSTPPALSEHPEVPGVNASLDALGPDGYVYFVTTNQDGSSEVRRVAPGSGAGGASGNSGGGTAGGAGGIGGAAGSGASAAGNSGAAGNGASGAAGGQAGASSVAGPCDDCTKLVACCNAAYPSSANCTSFPGQATNCSSSPSAFEGTCTSELVSSRPSSRTSPPVSETPTSWSRRPRPPPAASRSRCRRPLRRRGQRTVPRTSSYTFVQRDHHVADDVRLHGLN